MRTWADGMELSVTAVAALFVRGVSQSVTISNTAAMPNASSGQGNLLSGGRVASGGKGWCSINSSSVFWDLSVEMARHGPWLALLSGDHQAVNAQRRGSSSAAELKIVPDLRDVVQHVFQIARNR